MNLADIINAIQIKRVNITQHARQESRNDNLTLDEIFFSTIHGEIIEDYKEDKPYHSCLVNGETREGKPVHSVWAYAADSKIGILITVYCPDPNKWINWKTRREKL
ncbi:MAG: hypothetical protein B6I38_09675 [Anaerolineaceae bacterium 4572_5.1]|nr:MAG: hypothetical protein B5M51_08625 [Anaerolinea sp. 4484_236]OQY27858.1 MAG: hypothetical protein B6I38_09675 [Anaerolineaceae bacterium 4572_5.1]RLD06838.1 MAG: hypothetical protein DRI56_07480 [Chloroflexota bacterium]